MTFPSFRLIGIFLTLLATDAAATVRYVNLNCANPTPPYTGWSTAATNIQDAIDAATGSDLILVTNGVYQTGTRAIGGMSENRVAIYKAVTVQSVNGASVTSIRGSLSPRIRCVYLTNNAALVGFTLAGGRTLNSGNLSNYYGGGLWCESTNASVSDCVLSNNTAGFNGGGAFRGTLNNCLLISNSVPIGPGAPFLGGGTYGSVLNGCSLIGNSGNTGGGANASTLNNCILLSNSGHEGGGAESCTLNNCVLLWNHTSWSGGGAENGTLNNCTLVSNSATNSGGGAYNSALRNCIVFYNIAPAGSNYSGGTLSNCCATPLPPGGNNNTTNPPQFVNLAEGNLRLQTNSPCINTGTNSLSIGAVDLDGRPRIVNGTVDMGAYEFQGAGMGEFIGWLGQYGLPTNGSADSSDADQDRLNNRQEWIAGTVPTNASSVLKMFSPSSDVSGLNISWQSVSNRTYFLQRSTDLGKSPRFSTLKSNIVGQATTTTFLDTTATNGGSYFYRVGVQ